MTKPFQSGVLIINDDNKNQSPNIKILNQFLSSHNQTNNVAVRVLHWTLDIVTQHAGLINVVEQG
ncbi:MAG: hypothetical protein P8Q37_05710 [Porticoccaceae bacterium]|nr:hypothetical protein [Porticoccaceae bacterium]MDG1474380.1 hypothetical protein [Porticoccaceae bacterium]